MRVTVFVDVGDIARRALRARAGRGGLATRVEIESRILTMLAQDLAAAMRDLNAKKERRKP